MVPRINELVHEGIFTLSSILIDSKAICDKGNPMDFSKEIMVICDTKEQVNHVFQVYSKHTGLTIEELWDVVHSPLSMNEYLDRSLPVRVRLTPPNDIGIMGKSLISGPLPHFNTIFKRTPIL